MNLSQKIEEISVHYSDARKAVASFLLQNQSAISQLSMQEVADRTFTSKPTLTRFAKSLGYKGWIPFFNDYMEECHYAERNAFNIDANIPFEKDCSVSDMIEKIATLQMESLADTAYLLKTGEVVKAGELLLHARRTVIFGLAPNTMVAQAFRRKMEFIGKMVLIPSSDEFGTSAFMMEPNDCAIVVSYSGDNPLRDPMRYLPVLKNRRVKTIGITSRGDNYLRSNADVTLTMSTHERLYTKIANFATEDSLNLIFNVLYSYCFRDDYDNNFSLKVASSRRLEKNRLTRLKELKEEE